MARAGRTYVCRTCGQEVKVVKAGGGILVCCGIEMELVDE